MKITKVECTPLSLSRKAEGTGTNVVLIKIFTDEGIVGVADSGACYPEGVQDLILTLMKVWEPTLIGANPLDRELIITKLCNYLYNDMVQLPPAVATVDFALWDLVGKIYKQPVYQLLGGKANPKLKYNYFITGHASPTPEARAEEALKVVAGGCKSIALKAGPNWGNPDMAADVANVRAVRKAIGDRPDVELCVDTNGGYDYTSALDLGRRLEEFNLYKYEQPIPYWDIDGLANLRKNLNIPICAHESSTSIYGLLEVIKKNAADMAGLKVVWCGGITQAIKWGHIATTANLGVYCGGNPSPFESVAQAHWLASRAEYGKMAHANFHAIQYYGVFDTSGISNEEGDIVIKPMKYKDGYFYTPDGPGLGIELNEKNVPRYISKGKAKITLGK
jgi:L-alanine-DL-glutamate epimerase-like enolase superfamily enzyme